MIHWLLIDRLLIVWLWLRLLMIHWLLIDRLLIVWLWLRLSIVRCWLRYILLVMGHSLGFMTRSRRLVSSRLDIRRVGGDYIFLRGFRNGLGSLWSSIHRSWGARVRHCLSRKNHRDYHNSFIGTLISTVLLKCYTQAV